MWSLISVATTFVSAEAEGQGGQVWEAGMKWSLECDLEMMIMWPGTRGLSLCRGERQEKHLSRGEMGSKGYGFSPGKCCLTASNPAKHKHIRLLLDILTSYGSNISVDFIRNVACLTKPQAQ